MLMLINFLARTPCEGVLLVDYLHRHRSLMRLIHIVLVGEGSPRVTGRFNIHNTATQVFPAV